MADYYYLFGNRLWADLMLSGIEDIDSALNELYQLIKHRNRVKKFSELRRSLEHVGVITAPISGISEGKWVHGTQIFQLLTERWRVSDRVPKKNLHLEYARVVLACMIAENTVFQLTEPWRHDRSEYHWCALVSDEQGEQITLWELA